MGEKLKNNLKEGVYIPKWVVMLVVPILISLMGFTGNLVMAKQNIQDRVVTNEKHIEKNTEDIEKLELLKANKETETRIFQTLDRIENKLDKHIAND